MYSDSICLYEWKRNDQCQLRRKVPLPYIYRDQATAIIQAFMEAASSQALQGPTMYAASRSIRRTNHSMTSSLQSMLSNNYPQSFTHSFYVGKSQPHTKEVV